MTGRLLSAVAAFALVGAACTAGDGDAPPGGPGAELRASLADASFEEDLPGELEASETFDGDTTDVEVGTVSIGLQTPEGDSPGFISYVIYPDPSSAEQAFGDLRQRERGAGGGGADPELRFHKIDGLDLPHRCARVDPGGGSCFALSTDVVVMVSSRLGAGTRTKKGHINGVLKAALDHLEKVRAGLDG